MEKNIFELKTGKMPYKNLVGFLHRLGLFERNTPEIKKVYFNKDKGIVVTIFDDGGKEIAKCKKGDSFDLEVGIALCIAHKRFGAFNKYIANLKKTGAIVQAEDNHSKKKATKSDSK